MYFQITPTVVLSLIFLVLCACEPFDDDVQSANRSAAFAVPVDGKLSEKQVVNYIAIRKKINDRLQARDNSESSNITDVNKEQFPYFDIIEKEIALSFGMSYEEYSWVKEVIISTQTSLWLQRYYALNNKIVSLLESTLTRYKQTNAEMNDEQEQLKMKGYVNEMKQELSGLQQKMATSTKNTEEDQHNFVLIRKYQKDLNLLVKQ